MTQAATSLSNFWQRHRRPLVAGAVLCGILVAGTALLWKMCFHYVPPGRILVLTAKDGSPLPPEQVLAEPGQKGIQRQVLAEGWHFVLPLVNETELRDVTVIPPGKVGIVTALGGVPPRDGRVLAERDDEKGIRRAVLPPGAYRLNPYGFKVEQVPATHIEAGDVGVLRRRLGKDAKGRFAAADDEKGILRQVLQPGLYYINTQEYEVVKAEVGVNQKTYSANTGPGRAGDKATGAVVFPVRDGNTISMECTVEWEVLPQDMPQLVAEFGHWEAVERNVIDQQARKIARDRGFNYGAQDFLDGKTRETFQADFTHELEKVCAEKNVVVRSAFIRNILIPDNFLKQKRDRQLAAETKLTNEAKVKTAESENEVAREQTRVQQRVAEVQAETMKMVAETDREVENVSAQNEAEIEKLTAEYQAKIAALDAEKRKVLGEAEATVTKLRETAKSGLYRMKMDVFQNDGQAYLRYALSEQLNPQLKLRLFHAGPGTFWTNMGEKGMNLMLPAAPPAPAATTPGKAATP
jgi:regulator of protease activity HflC (stomatin/prohibitin superfamily)